MPVYEKQLNEAIELHNLTVKWEKIKFEKLGNSSGLGSGRIRRTFIFALKFSSSWNKFTLKSIFNLLLFPNKFHGVTNKKFKVHTGNNITITTKKLEFCNIKK